MDLEYTCSILDGLEGKYDFYFKNCFVFFLKKKKNPFFFRAYGVGSRMDIPVTRACVDAILEGKLDGVKTNPHPVFQVGIPENVPGVPTELLDPRNTWANKAEYDATAANLAQMFVKNYKQYQGGDVPDYSSHGPKV